MTGGKLLACVTGGEGGGVGGVVGVAVMEVVAAAMVTVYQPHHRLDDDAH
jgi:hypothetical protein